MHRLWNTVKNYFHLFLGGGRPYHSNTKMHNSKLPVSLSMHRIAEVLSKARKNLRLSYRQLSAISGVSGASIARIEAGMGEHSVSKFFRLCVALGVPASDLIAYAIVNTVPMPERRLTDHPDIQTAIQWAMHFQGIPPRESLEKLNEIALYLYRLLVETLCGARPTVGLVGQHIQSEKCNERLESLQIEMDSFSNGERLAALETLLNDPVAKLKSLRLLTPAIMEEALSQKGPCVLLKYETPESVENVLFYQDQPQSVAPGEKSGKPSTRPVPEEKAKQVLTDASVNVIFPPMKSELEELLCTARRLTKPRGMKTKLAKALRVPLPRVSDWLAGNYMPSGRRALELREWVRAQEGQQKQGPESAITLARPKTQPKASNEKKPKSSPPKR